MMPFQERRGIVGFPSHWLGGIIPSGFFSSPRNNIVDVVIEGSAVRGTSPDFDVNEALSLAGLGQFHDSVQVRWFRGLRVTVHFSRFRNEEGPAPSIRQLASMLSLRSVIHDGTIQRICVQDGLEGPMFLWAMFPRQKIKSTGRYDNWGNAIDNYNLERLRRHRRVASLDLIAFSEDSDWMFGRGTIETAIADAYRPRIFKPALLELVRGTDAENVITIRDEPAAPELAPVVLRPLFA
jgi:hypothetical protein